MDVSGDLKKNRDDTSERARKGKKKVCFFTSAAPKSQMSGKPPTRKKTSSKDKAPKRKRWDAKVASVVKALEGGEKKLPSNEGKLKKSQRKKKNSYQ